MSGDFKPGPTNWLAAYGRGWFGFPVDEKAEANPGRLSAAINSSSAPPVRIRAF
jgi:hypothetical protein